MHRRFWQHTTRAAVMLLSVFLLQACKSDLYSGLDERQANQMISELSRNGIQASRHAAKDGTLTVTVDEDQFAASVQVLEASGLPEARFASLGDVFKNNGLVASPTQERAQFVYAMSQELSNTVSQVDGIRMARVHVDLPDDDTRRKSNSRASAAVFVRYDAGADIEPLIPKIKALVAGSISTLEYERVSVIPIAALASEVSNTVRMTTWLGIPIPEKSASRLTQLALVVVLLGAALIGGAFWWSMRRLPRGVRTYRQSS